MRNFLTALVLLTLSSCLSEKGVKPGNVNTFVRYYNGGNNDQAVGMEETSDKGFIIVATTKVQKAEADIPNYKIKVIRTDLYGNVTWTKLFPDAAEKNINYTASSIQINPAGGYVIVGDDIQSDGSTKILLMTIDESGNLGKSGSYQALDGSGTAVSGHGEGVTINAAGNFLVLSTAGTDIMYLSEVSKDSFTAPLWTVLYQDGATSLANRLFVDVTGKVIWSGMAVKDGLTGIRLVKTAPNSKFTDFDLLISIPTISETANDICAYGFGYAVTGYTTNKPAGSTGTDTDILFKRLGQDGTVLSSTVIPFDGQNDAGNSISTTQDGGVIILASVGSAGLTAKLGPSAGAGDTDYYLQKINAFGDKMWESSFGSKYKDDGVTVRQTNDGGYAVLGTTTQGGLKIITLIKTDNVGKIQ